MISNKIVIRYIDGRVEKGITTDFFPNRDFFHIQLQKAGPDARPLEIHVQELKAVFFVKDYEGNRDYNDKKEFEPGKNVAGRKIQVVFADGELMVGTTTGYQPDRTGFFVVPADMKSNIERCFVVMKATREVKFI